MIIKKESVILKNNPLIIDTKQPSLFVRVNETEKIQEEKMKAYYRFHSLIYDWTRWAFLFGRKRIVHSLPYLKSDHLNILEVGCGTGTNLQRLTNEFPNAQIKGLDISAQMLGQAKKRLKNWDYRIELFEKPYQKSDSTFEGQMDLVLFSYSLSMINPQWKELI
ncbi:class I SAM-dependent methyltransferase [Saprospiraceae bacterium]|jgi:S-adenosylmethionine-diacylgycerolhomoserine-N-methlytransferase|nr:class I SAM-dependent methyltransferase [Saprospiraceae bacterium]